MLKVKLRVQEGPHLARNIVCVHLANLSFAETLNSEQGCILGNWTITIRSIGRGKYLHFGLLFNYLGEGTLLLRRSLAQTQSGEIERSRWATCLNEMYSTVSTKNQPATKFRIHIIG